MNKTEIELLQFVIVVFPDHTHLLFFVQSEMGNLHSLNDGLFQHEQTIQI